MRMTAVDYIKLRLGCSEEEAQKIAEVAIEYNNIGIGGMYPIEDLANSIARFNAPSNNIDKLGIEIST